MELRSGDLVIEGDEGDNAVTVSQQGLGFIRVQGHNGTTVNGSSFTQYLNAGVVQDDIRADFTAGGNNTLKIDGLRIGDDVVYRGGDGQDQVGVSQGLIDGDVNIRTEGGHDVVMMDRVEMDGKLTVNTGGGSDRVGFGGEGMTVQANIVTGSGRDSVVAGFVEEDSRLKIRTGHADDDVFIYLAQLETLDINTGKGNDEVWMRDVTVDGRAKAKGGAGTDNFEQVNVNANMSPGSFEGTNVQGGAVRALELASDINDLFANL